MSDPTIIVDLSAPFSVEDYNGDFPVPDHSASASDDELAAAPSVRVESGEGVTGLLDRATRRLGGRTHSDKDSVTVTEPGAETKRGPGRPKRTDAEKVIPIPSRGFAPGIEKAYMTLGALTLPFNVDIGTTIIGIAPDAAKALDELARQNPAFRRFLVNMMKTTTVGAVIAAHAPLIAIIAKQAMSSDPRASQMFSMFDQDEKGSPDL